MTANYLVCNIEVTNNGAEQKNSFFFTFYIVL